MVEPTVDAAAVVPVARGQRVDVAVTLQAHVTATLDIAALRRQRRILPPPIAWMLTLSPTQS
ncbi:hypothetical protein [Ralstonia pseudosolanacearum]|uniref:hypothetical protein n=1 Tax=Ralstonia pseudosolanacearum TaxID=1310165 RepID=UPI00339A334A